MSSVTPFVLPKGTSLAIGGNSLVVRHDGDIVMEQTLGRRLSRVEAGGDLTLRCSPITGVLHAAGVLTTEGDVDAQELRAEVIHIGPGDVRARAIVGTKKVVIGAARLTIDVIVAPHVEISDDARGRVRVVDSLNERPATRVRGCLSLEDYEADFGGAAEFLARRGVISVNPLPGPPDAAETGETGETAEPTPQATVTAAPAPAPSEPGDQEDAPDDVFAMDFSEVFVDEPTDTEPHPVVAQAEVEWDNDLEAEPEFEYATFDPQAHLAKPPVSAPSDAAAPHPIAPEPVAEPVPVATPAPAATHLDRHAPSIRRSVARIVEAYGADLPPSVHELREVTERGQFSALGGALDELWLGLLRHHLRASTQPPRVVIQSFQSIHAMFE
jgi:hypothetical protein